MSVEELMAIVPPPNEPLCVGDPSKWPDIERELGIALPSDYREFVSRYGVGVFDENMVIYSPFANGKHTRLVSRVQINSAAINSYRDPDEFPYAMYPESPGLITWAHDFNSNYYAWFTKGKPDSWPVVAFDRELLSCDKFKMPMTRFLAQAVQRKIRCSFWNDDFPSPPRDCKFKPVNESD